MRYGLRFKPTRCRWASTPRARTTSCFVVSYEFRRRPHTRAHASLGSVLPERNTGAGTKLNQATFLFQSTQQTSTARPTRPSARAGRSQPEVCYLQEQEQLVQSTVEQTKSTPAGSSNRCAAQDSPRQCEWKSCNK
jgi:hypothetical protein